MELGLALSGGGIKGAAHIGALKALEEENIKIDYISGASCGSIIATLYAIGYSPEEIFILFKKYSKKIKYIDFKNILKIIYGILIKRKIIIKGLNSGEIIEKLINEMAKNKKINNINEIKFPLLIPAVDLHTGKIYNFYSGNKRINFSDEIININNINIGKAVRASCSYPLVFAPCKYKNTELIDGGIRENVPWSGIKKLGADKVISISFEKQLPKDYCSNVIDVVSNSIDILCHELATYELDGTDCLIKIKTKNISLLDSKKINFLYELGYKTIKENINLIKNI